MGKRKSRNGGGEGCASFFDANEWTEVEPSVSHAEHVSQDQEELMGDDDQPYHSAIPSFIIEVAVADDVDGEIPAVVDFSIPRGQNVCDNKQVFAFLSELRHAVAGSGLSSPGLTAKETLWKCEFDDLEPGELAVRLELESRMSISNVKAKERLVIEEPTAAAMEDNESSFTVGHLVGSFWARGTGSLLSAPILSNCDDEVIMRHVHMLSSLHNAQWQITGTSCASVEALRESGITVPNVRPCAVDLPKPNAPNPALVLDNKHQSVSQRLPSRFLQHVFSIDSFSVLPNSLISGNADPPCVASVLQLDHSCACIFLGQLVRHLSTLSVEDVCASFEIISDSMVCTDISSVITTSQDAVVSPPVIDNVLAPILGISLSNHQTSTLFLWALACLFCMDSLCDATTCSDLLFLHKVSTVLLYGIASQHSITSNTQHSISLLYSICAITRLKFKQHS